jgi:hypothetical protein
MMEVTSSGGNGLYDCLYIGDLQWVRPFSLRLGCNSFLTRVFSCLYLSLSPVLPNPCWRLLQLQRKLVVDD